MRTHPLEWRIRTPEGVTFTYELAGPIYRALAWGIDVAVIVVVGWGIQIVTLPVQFISMDAAAGLIILLYFLASVGYAVLLEWLWRGQTLGKRLLGIRVQDAYGLRLRFSQVLIRNLFRAVDNLPVLYLVGVASMLCTRRAQRLGDVAGNTMVVRIPRPLRPDLSQVTPPIYNSLRDQPHIAARYRQLVTPREASLALQAVLRRDQLDAAARVEVFQELARYFRGLVHLPEEVVRGVTDEQYIRNLVDVLYHASPNVPKREGDVVFRSPL